MTGLMLSNRSVSLRAGVAIIIGGMALLLSACGLRLETDPVTFPSPDTTTVARDTLADAEVKVLAAAADAGASADEVAVGAAATAQAHLDALGGVYVAYPGTTPAPSPATTPPLAEAIDTVRATAEAIASTSEDANLAFLARSIDLDWALRELWAARVAANATANKAAALSLTSPTPDPSTSDPAAIGPLPLPGDRGDAPFPLAGGKTNDAAGFAPDSTTMAGLTVEQLSALAVVEDEARFAYETIAALEFSDRRDDVLARSRLHASRSDALSALVTADPSTPDPRTPLYQLRDANLADPSSREALGRSIEIDLGARYAALLDGASAADASWLMNAAFDSYARAMATAGFTTADLPTLPGLLVGS